MTQAVASSSAGITQTLGWPGELGADSFHTTLRSPWDRSGQLNGDGRILAGARPSLGAASASHTATALGRDAP
jgi:hypothetical protein